MAKDADLVSCKPCNGSGTNWGFGADYCPLCKGQGLVPNEPLRTIVCAPCKGTGRKMATLAPLCEICGGYGSIEPHGAKPAEPTGTLVWFVKAGTPFSERQRLASVLEELRGDVCVVEPYYGPGLLSALQHLKACDTVRCLTRQLPKGGKAVVEHDIKLFKQEYANAEFQISNSGDLHDRYVLTDKRILILGQGLKDFGKDDSFLIGLDDSVAKDMIKSAKTAFEAHWAAATALG